MLSRAYRLGGPTHVAQVMKTGRKARSGDLLFFFLPTELPAPRLAVVVSKKVSKKAVERNYLRRVIYEVARQPLQEWGNRPKGDIVVVVLRQPEANAFEVLRTNFEQWLKK